MSWEIWLIFVGVSSDFDEERKLVGLMGLAFLLNGLVTQKEQGGLTNVI